MYSVRCTLYSIYIYSILRTLKVTRVIVKELLVYYLIHCVSYTHIDIVIIVIISYIVMDIHYYGYQGTEYLGT